jgi:hypothetical protein
MSIPQDLDVAMDHFEKHGPHTWATLWDLVEQCAAGDECQVGDSLDECLHKFSPDDISQIFLVKKHLSQCDLKIWRKGTSEWSFTHIHPDLSDAKCEVIAQHVDWDKIACDLNTLPLEVRTRMVKALRTTNRNLRDRSPTRS